MTYNPEDAMRAAQNAYDHEEAPCYRWPVWAICRCGHAAAPATCERCEEGGCTECIECDPETHDRYCDGCRAAVARERHRSDVMGQAFAALAPHASR